MYYVYADVQPLQRSLVSRHSGTAESFLLALARDMLPNPGSIQYPIALCCKHILLIGMLCSMVSVSCGHVVIEDSVYRELQTKDTYC